MSEVARLREQIELELVALRRGLNGISSGYARHVFIHTRMNRIGDCQDSLAGHVGKDDALLFVCQLYERVMEPEQV